MLNRSWSGRRAFRQDELLRSFFQISVSRSVGFIVRDEVTSWASLAASRPFQLLRCVIQR
ncbi:hypothetical protein SCHPADRAFT_456765 [Schizopora paradoxa]|uniref:Uncharacterized protein n=1 Tax=Schizopora paradoxa TaxID=27342 RepID=A0A0H2RIT2_9AGAM|nr:hypothetical protein SCHPADRAFT_456765 [Schizopora paradoxa]